MGMLFLECVCSVGAWGRGKKSVERMSGVAKSGDVCKRLMGQWVTMKISGRAVWWTEMIIKGIITRLHPVMFGGFKLLLKGQWQNSVWLLIKNMRRWKKLCQRCVQGCSVQHHRCVQRCNSSLSSKGGVQIWSSVQLCGSGTLTWLTALIALHMFCNFEKSFFSESWLVSNDIWKLTLILPFKYSRICFFCLWGQNSFKKEIKVGVFCSFFLKLLKWVSESTTAPPCG